MCDRGIGDACAGVVAVCSHRGDGIAAGGMKLTISDELRAFMREVAAKLDWVDDRTTMLGGDALVHECGRGGRVEGSDVYRFTYLARDGHGRWELELREQQIRDIGAGHLSEIDAEELEPGTRTQQRGEPLLVWGEYDDDALRARTLGDLALALDALYTIGHVDRAVPDPAVVDVR